MRTLLVLLCLTPSLALGQARTFDAMPGSSLAYVLIHRFKQVKGTSDQVTARARLLPDGKLQVAARAPVASFDSGNANRDTNMQLATEAAKHPHVELKAAANRVVWPTRYPSTAVVTLEGRLTFHGVQKPLTLPLDVTFSSPTHATATGSFSISLEAHGVDRPALLFVRVDDAVKIEVKLLLEADRP